MSSVYLRRSKYITHTQQQVRRPGAQLSDFVMQDDSIDEGVLTDTKVLGEMHGAWNQSIRYSYKRRFLPIKIKTCEFPTAASALHELKTGFVESRYILVLTTNVGSRACTGPWSSRTASF